MLVAGCEKHSKRMDAHNIANGLWGLGIVKDLGVPSDQAVFALRSKALDICSEFTTQGLANMSWGLALLGQRDLTLFNLIAKRMTKEGQGLARNAVTMDLPQICCAFARIWFRHDAFMSAVEQHAASLFKA